MLVTLKPELSQLSTRGLKFDLGGIDVNKGNDILRHLARLAAAGRPYRTATVEPSIIDNGVEEALGAVISSTTYSPA